MSLSERRTCFDGRKKMGNQTIKDEVGKKKEEKQVVCKFVN